MLSNIIIFPLDPTTDFLNEIIQFLEKKRVSFIILKPALEEKEQKKQFRILETAPINSKIVFLGHGASHCFYGALNSSQERSALIEKNNLNLFSNKSLVALSCRSEEFLKINGRENGLKSWLGFGDMKTDWDDVMASRESEGLNAVDYEPEDIINFREILVEVIKHSLFEFLSTDRHISYLYRRIKLRLNKQMSIIQLAKRDRYNIITDMLYDMKVGMDCYY